MEQLHFLLFKKTFSKLIFLLLTLFALQIGTILSEIIKQYLCAFDVLVFRKGLNNF